GRGALVLAGVPDRRGESRGLHLRGRPRRGGGPRAAGAPRLAPGPAAGARVRAGSPLPPIDLRRRRTGGREGRSMTASAVPLRPRVRYVECQPLEQGGQRSFLLSDPTGLAPNPVVVSPAVVFLLQRFDGRHTLPEIAASLKEATGEEIGLDQLEGLVRSLDDARLLDSEAFRAFRDGLLAEYRGAEHRPFLHGGTAYPVTPSELAAWHGSLDARPLETATTSGRVVGAAAPHIDLRFG